MRKLRALADRVVSLAVPAVTAKAAYTYEYKCGPRCGHGYATLQRTCGGGSCTGWVRIDCNC
ncbi:hypothetical protein [Actinoplanes utahensis]|nr:hypothetical protein [Actinoplanes utahensis]